MFDLIGATIILFNLVLGAKGDEVLHPMETLKKGFILIGKSISPVRLKIILDTQKDVASLNAGFYNSFSDVENASEAELFINQLLNYFTRYGLGLTNDNVYVPRTELQVPALTEGDDIAIKVIRLCDIGELSGRVTGLLSKNTGLKPEMLEALSTVVNNGVSVDLTEVVNREAQMFLYDKLDEVPTDPTTFLRYLIYALTGETMLVKSRDLIAKIKRSSGAGIGLVMRERAPENLASIFYRFKPLFLAIRSISDDKKVFNQLRRNAVKQHVPYVTAPIDMVTANIKKGIVPDYEILEDASTPKLVGLLGALATMDMPQRVYRIRTGRTWVDPEPTVKVAAEDVLEAQELTRERISSELVSRLIDIKGKKFYTGGMVYAIPGSGKDFVGGTIPAGSSITMRGEAAIGVHWYNNEYSVDLDLAALSAKGKVGFGGAFRGLATHSGDMTDAPRPNGAVEFIKLSPESGVMLLSLNDFSQTDGGVDYSLIAGKPGSKEDRFLMSPADMTIRVNSHVTGGSVIGIVVPDREANTITLYLTSGNSIDAKAVSLFGEREQVIVANLLVKLNNQLTLNKLLELAGAEIVEELGDEMVDISPNKLSSGTLLNLFKSV